MMLSVLLLSSSILVTHAPGWSAPMITTDLWNYGFQYKTIEVIDSLIHQSWNNFNQGTRVGYKVYLPDGTVIFPETMISGDVWSSYVNSTIANSDSVVITWREGSPAYYTVRESDGSEAVPTSLYIPDPWMNQPGVYSSGDSLGRIHSTFVISDAGTQRVCYRVFEPGVGEVWRDTIPGSNSMPRILVDGTRVHIVFRGEDLWPDYIQYDLEGNVTVPTVSLAEDLIQFISGYTLALDSDRNLYTLLKLARSWTYLSLFKIDGETGDILIDDKEIWDPIYSCGDPIILPGSTDDMMYLLWRESEQDYMRHVKFAIIDTNGDFIEAPYSAYDYTDERIQHIQVLKATVNEDRDIFAIWNQGDVGVGGYWIVMGWFDHNWVGVSEDEEEQNGSTSFDLVPSLNPFYGSVVITAGSDPLPGQLLVYAMSGRLLRTLYQNGEGSFLWDGCDAEGNDLPSGSYIIQGASAYSRASTVLVKL